MCRSYSLLQATERFDGVRKTAWHRQCCCQPAMQSAGGALALADSALLMLVAAASAQHPLCLPQAQAKLPQPTGCKRC